MNQNRIAAVGVVLAGLVFLAIQSFFIVGETQRALVLRFGEVRAALDRPGLYLKLPFIDRVINIEDRLLPLQTPELEVADSEQRRFSVDAVARWKVVDTLRFYQAVGGNLAAANARLDPILSAAVRQVIGARPFAQVLFEARADVTRQIEDLAQANARNLGVELVDVRIRRAEQPDDISARTFERMRSDRQREATDIRARGQEQARRIRAEAENQAVVIRAEARRQSETLRGRGDAERNRVLAEAYGRDAEFFSFYRSMLAYQNALGARDTTFLLSPNSEFFRYFADPSRGPAQQQPAR